jgi:hypothetical protein
VPGRQVPGGGLVDLRKSGDSRSTSIIPIMRSAGPNTQIRNRSRLARTRSDSGSARRCTIGSRLDWWLDTTTQGAAARRCSRPPMVTRAPAARSHTAAHHRIIRSVAAESARPGPRHRTSRATARDASTPAANVGTVRQDTRPPLPPASPWYLIRLQAWAAGQALLMAIFLAGSRFGSGMRISRTPAL